MAYVVGVEASAEQLTCVLLDVQTRAAAFCSTAATTLDFGDLHLPIQEAASELLAAVEGCLAEAKRELGDVVAVAIASAAMEAEGVCADMKTALAAKLPQGVALSLHGASVAALSAATGGKLHGVVLAAGASTVAYGTLDNGRVSARTIAWGTAFGEGGSAFDLGSRCLAAVSKARDGRGADTLLCNAVLQHLKLRTDEQLCRWAAGHDLAQRVAEVSGLAGVVIDVASRGDAVADTILKHGVGELFRSAKAVSTKLGLERSRQPYKLVLAGRLLEEGSLYSQYLLETLKDSFPTSDVCYPTVSLAEGAAWVAWAAAKAKAPAAPAAGPVGEAAEGEGEGSADPAGAAVVAAAEAAGAAAAASTAADTTSTQAQAAQLPGPVTEP